MKQPIDKQKILADFKTGGYSQRELSKKHNVSLGTINKITKNEIKENEHLVNAQKEILHATDALPAIEMYAVMNTAQDKYRREKIINNNAELIASKIPIMLDQIDSPNDLKLLAEANDKLAITLKVADRHAKSGDINVSSQQNVALQTITRRIID